MTFNFQRFVGNIMQTAQASTQIVQAKEEQKQSLHKTDYINIGMLLLGSLFDAIDHKVANSNPEEK